MICKKCDKNKNESDFYASDNRCKKCLSEKSNTYYKTKKGVASRIMLAQKANSKLRNHVAPVYNKQQLTEWLFSQQLFHVLYEEWEKSNYEKLLKPSCDRIDETKPYSFENIELKTYGDNLKEAYKIALTGKRDGRPVIQLTLDNEQIQKYDSIAIAKRETGIHNIFYVCSGSRKKAGGYKWEYSNE